MSEQIQFLRKDILSKIDYLDASAAFRDINEDLIVLESMTAIFNSSKTLHQVQFICGYAIERCNIAFINSNRKSSDFLSALGTSTRDIKRVDETAGAVFGLIGRSFPVLMMINGW